MIHRLLPLIVAVQVLLPTPAGGQDQAALVRYDLRPVMPSHDAGSSWTESMVSALADPYDELPHVNLSNLYSIPPPEVVLEVVTRVLGDDLMQQGRMVTLDTESSLLVVAPKSVQARVRQVLAALSAALTRSETLRLEVLTLSEGAGDALLERNVLSAAQADELVASMSARGAVRRTFTLELLPGRTTLIDQSRSVPYLHDVDIELATGSIGFDPNVLEVDEGLRVLARGTPVVGGVAVSMAIRDAMMLGEITTKDLQVRGGFGHAEKGGVEFVDGPRRIQSLALGTSAVAFTAVVPDGEAIAMASEAHGAGATTTRVYVLRRDGAAAGAAPAANSVKFGTITMKMINSEMFRVPTFSFERRDSLVSHGSHPTISATLNSEPTGFLFDWLKYRFSVWRRVGPWAIVVTDPAWDDQSGQELTALVASIAAGPQNRSVSVDLRSQGSSRARWSLPVLEGTSAGASIGNCTSVISEFDIEVGGQSSAAAPVVSPLFEGLSLELGISRGAELFLVARGVGQIRDGSSPTDVEMNGPFTGIVENARVSWLSFDERTTVQAGQRVTLGASPSTSAGSASSTTAAPTNRAPDLSLTIELH